MKKKSRNFTLFPLFSNISYAVHPFKEIRCHVISIADKRHYMKMETCITLLWRWNFFSQLFLRPIVGGQVTPVRSHEKRPLEVTWVELALGSTCFEQQRYDEEIYLEDGLGKDTEIKVKTRDGLDKDTVHPGGTPKEEGGGRKKGVAILNEINFVLKLKVLTNKIKARRGEIEPTHDFTFSLIGNYHFANIWREISLSEKNVIFLLIALFKAGSAGFISCKFSTSSSTTPRFLVIFIKIIFN